LLVLSGTQRPRKLHSPLARLQASVFTPTHTLDTHFFSRIAKELPSLAPDALLWLGVDISHVRRAPSCSFRARDRSAARP
jgi:hypothetical protein